MREAATAAGIPPLPPEVDVYPVKTATGFSPDGSILLSCAGVDVAKSFDAASGSLLASAPLPIYPYNFSFQGGVEDHAVAMDDLVTLLLEEPRTLAVSAVTSTTDGFPTVDRRVAALTVTGPSWSTARASFCRLGFGSEDRRRRRRRSSLTSATRLTLPCRQTAPPSPSRVTRVSPS